MRTRSPRRRPRQSHRLIGHVAALALAWVGLAAGCTASTDVLAQDPGVCVQSLAQGGEDEICAACMCGRFAPDVLGATQACYGDDSCRGVLECSRAHDCVGLDCYCGAALSCGLEPAGPCRDAMAAVVGRKLALLTPADNAKTLELVKGALGDAGSTLGRAAVVMAGQRGTGGYASGEGLCAERCAGAGKTCNFISSDPSCQDRFCSLDGRAQTTARTPAGSAVAPVPEIDSIEVAGAVVWRRGDASAPSLTAGQEVTLRGAGFGSGPDVDFAKLMVGNVRVLETDLRMYQSKLQLLHPEILGPALGQAAKMLLGGAKLVDVFATLGGKLAELLHPVFHESDQTHDRWAKDILAWQDDEIVFRVPGQAVPGDQAIRIQVQRRTGPNPSLVHGGPHRLVDAQALRVTDDQGKLVDGFDYTCDEVSQLGPPSGSEPVTVHVDNAEFAALAALGQQMFWSYDYNLGLAHSSLGLDWETVLGLAGKPQATDPVTGAAANPFELFGAYKIVPDGQAASWPPDAEGQVPESAVPAAAFGDVAFAPYPQQTPIPGQFLVGSPMTQGTTRSTGWVGFRYAEANHPMKGPGSWVGFNCSSCHGYRVDYQKGTEQITKVIPGLPNPRWTVKWILLGQVTGITGDEEGPAWAAERPELGGKQRVDKTALLYSVPQGTAEATMVRPARDGSATDNDYQFSPIAIPNVTNYLAVRRSLSHTESYVGFEGSYTHAEEPDGASGSMHAHELQALTAYMSTLDQDDRDLRNVGIYRWLQFKQSSGAEIGALFPSGVGEGDFVQAGWDSYPDLAAPIEKGRALFEEHCASCHQDTLGLNSSEKMIPLSEVGRFFPPTLYQKEAQSIRATFLDDLYWVQHRGLLSDGHVRNLEDLVSPDRCDSSSELYKSYYTLQLPVARPSPGPDFVDPYPADYVRGTAFRVKKRTAADNLFIERHKYFVDGATLGDPDHYYFDYQGYRKAYGPWELGSAGPIFTAAAPHPYCLGADQRDQVDALVLYLLTL